MIYFSNILKIRIPVGAHHFGGKWTEDKLDKLSSYLSSYAMALRDQNFSLWYIDGFAGTGAVTIKKDGNDLEIPGSAWEALETSNKFDRYIFIDSKRKYVKALQDVVANYSELDIKVLHNDCNVAIKSICSEIKKNWKNRAVLFLDPYGMQVEWSTIENIAMTKKIDLWYLFPTEGANRQLPNDANKIDHNKVTSLNRIFGTNEWRTLSYRPSPQKDMFAGEQEEKNITKEGLESFMKERLDSIFAETMDPYRFYRDNHHQFSLFCCISNPAPKAIGLAQRLIGSIFNK